MNYIFRDLVYRHKKILSRIILLSTVLLPFLTVELSYAQAEELGTFRITTEAQPQNASKVLNLRGHQHNAILSYNGYQYVAFYSINGNDQSTRFVNLGRRKLSNSTWEVIKFEDYLQVTDDSHNVISIGICEGDGTIHLIFDQHNGSVPLRYRVSVRGLASQPENHRWISSKFGNVLGSLPGTETNSIANKNFTYPRFFSAPNGNLQMIRRHGSAVNGASHLYTYSKTSHAWQHHGEIINGRAVEYTKPDTGVKTKLGPYLNGVNYQNNRLHITWIWRTTGTTSNNNFDFMYAYSDDFGITWKNRAGRIAGRAASQPMTYKNPVPVKVFDFPEGTGLTNQTGQTVDDSGRVHVYQTRNVSGGRRFSHLYMDTDGTWVKNETNIRSQRGKITHDSKGNVYAIHRSGTIYKATSQANYTNWSALRSNNEFAGEPQYDENLVETDGILSMLVAAPDASKEMFSLDIKIENVAENQSPIVSFVAPTDRTVDEGYAELYVRASASDPDGDPVSLVLYINDEEIRQEINAPYEWGHATSPNRSETLNLPEGRHEFKVIATDSNGAVAQDMFTLVVQSGILNVVENTILPVQIYPNPGKNVLFIDTAGLDDFQLTIYDLSGKKVDETAIVPGINQIYTSFLEPGAYMLMFKNKERKQVLKYMKL